MNNEDPQVDIQALVDAAVKEAVAQSLAELKGLQSRQQARNENREKRRDRYEEERNARISAKKDKEQPPRKEEKGPIAEKAEEGRKFQNQNLGQQEPRVVPARQQKPEIEKRLTISEAVGPLHAPLPRNGFNPREFLYAATAQASFINHPWKVYNDGTFVKAGSPEILGKYGIIGGTVYSQGGSITVPDQELIGGPGSNPSFVYLEIIRDSHSRELSSASIKQGSTVPNDSASVQCRPLAIVYGTSGRRPLQLQFQEIRVWELMLVENGEFALHTFDTNNRTSYAPP